MTSRIRYTLDMDFYFFVKNMIEGREMRYDYISLHTEVCFCLRCGAITSEEYKFIQDASDYLYLF